MAQLFYGKEMNVVLELGQFARGLVERPEVYGVRAEDAAEALRLTEAYEAAVALTSSPDMRTSPNFAAKREAMRAAQTFCAKLAAFIRLNPGLSNADRIVLGIAPPAPRKRIPAPTTRPLLELGGIVPGGHVLRFVDSQTPDRKGKPYGVVALEVFVAFTSNGSELRFDELVSRAQASAQPYTRLTRTGSPVLHPEARVGNVANYIGRWVNNRGETGPWSQPVRMMLALPLEAGVGGVGGQERLAA